MDFSPVPLLDVLPHHRVLDITGSSCKDLALALHERLLTKEDGARSSSGKVWAAQPWQVPQGLLFANAARPEDLEPLMATVPEKLRGPVVFTVSPPQSFPADLHGFQSCSPLCGAVRSGFVQSEFQP